MLARLAPGLGLLHGVEGLKRGRTVEGGDVGHPGLDALGPGLGVVEGVRDVLDGVGDVIAGSSLLLHVLRGILCSHSDVAIAEDGHFSRDGVVPLGGGGDVGIGGLLAVELLAVGGAPDVDAGGRGGDLRALGVGGGVCGVLGVIRGAVDGPGGDVAGAGGVGHGRLGAVVPGLVLASELLAVGGPPVGLGAGGLDDGRALGVGGGVGGVLGVICGAVDGPGGDVAGALGDRERVRGGVSLGLGLGVELLAVGGAPDVDRAGGRGAVGHPGPRLAGRRHAEGLEERLGAGLGDGGAAVGAGLLGGVDVTQTGGYGLARERGGRQDGPGDDRGGCGKGGDPAANARPGPGGLSPHVLCVHSTSPFKVPDAPAADC